MKNNTYKNAVEHLEFSDDLYDRVAENAQVTSRPICFARAVAIAAVITVLLTTTALAVGTYIKDKLVKNETSVPVQTLGTADDRFDDAQLMAFALSDDMDGIKVHYMELDFSNGVKSYRFEDGILWGYTGNGDQYFRITDGYQLEAVQMQSSDAQLQKGEWVYEFPYDYRYVITENGVVSNYHNARAVNENGEILTHVYRLPERPSFYGSDISWPVYLNVKTGQIRDALPQLSPEDFPDQDVYARHWKGGLLIHPKLRDGQLDFYWITEDSAQPVRFSIPAEGEWIPGKDTIYYRDEWGNHYCLDESFRLQPASPYNTYAMPGAGLLEVMTDDCKLGIYDLETGVTYVFNEIDVNRGSFNDTSGYYTKTSVTGRIALIKGGVEFDPYRPIIEQIGILDVENGQLRLLQIENGYAKSYCSWLDGDRLGVIYEKEDRQYLCIYEFE